MLLSALIAAPPTRPLGPYATASRVYTVPALDATGHRLHVFWPSNASTGEKFPLVPYLHGYLGGGLDILAYYDLFHDISSYGFVVAAPASCSTTCDDRIGLPYTSCGGLPAGPDPLLRRRFGERGKRRGARRQGQEEEDLGQHVDGWRRRATAVSEE